MAFSDVVAKLTEGIENIGDVQAYVQELNDEHAKELDIRQTKISDLEGTVESLKESEKSLKLVNYDLVMRTGVSGGEGGQPEPTPEAPEPTKGINSLFKPKE